MKKRIKIKWLRALRSGKYKQGRGRLRNKSENTFCCLGVLCDLHAKELKKAWKDGENENRMYYMKESAVLPETVRKWAGLDTSNGGYRYGERTSTLASINDGGRSFEHIANIIEKKF